MLIPYLRIQCVNACDHTHTHTLQFRQVDVASNEENDLSDSPPSLAPLEAVGPLLHSRALISTRQMMM